MNNWSSDPMDAESLRARLALKERDFQVAQACASELEQHGFDVIQVGERGVSFTGPARLFEAVFGSAVVVSDSQPRFASDPVLPAAFSDAVDSVYFPTKPTFFP